MRVLEHCLKKRLSKWLKLIFLKYINTLKFCQTTKYIYHKKDKKFYVKAEHMVIDMIPSGQEYYVVNDFSKPFMWRHFVSFKNIKRVYRQVSSHEEAYLDAKVELLR